MCVEESNKIKKEKNVLRLPTTKVVMWGGVPDAINNAKFRQNWFKGFSSLTGQNLPFP